MALELKAEPLRPDAFAEFDQIISIPGQHSFSINRGSTIRHHDLAEIDVIDGDGHAILNMFRCQPRPSPLRLDLMERHPLGSQTFIPPQDREWLVVVGASANPLDYSNLRAFRAKGTQGITQQSII